MKHLSYSEQTQYWNHISAEHAQQIAAAEAELIQSARTYPGRIVVLDDDPTGVQTVHDIPVYTDWSQQTIEDAFTAEDPLFYILTNSRGLQEEETEPIHREIAERCLKAAKGLPFQMISRSDSTLRGHYPLETDVLESVLKEKQGPCDGLILAPFFEAGGRFTIGNVHYVKTGDELVPAAETEFARDETFGYSKSDLREYVEEKTGGRIPASAVRSVDLMLLRTGDVEAAAQILTETRGGVPVIVNALSPQDMRVFCAALYRALNAGRHFVYRTAADFVKAFGAVTDRPLLSREELLGGAEAEAAKAGLVIAGSHTAKTTRQLEKLEGLAGLDRIPFRAAAVLDGTLDKESERVRALVEQDLVNGVTPVVFTERQVLQVEGDTKESALQRSVEISDALCSVVGGLKIRPAFLIAKGGITSSDLGVKALQVKKAEVAGQILPGIPVWRCGEESRFPGIPYVIFPGNVGEEDSLRTILELLL